MKLLTLESIEKVRVWARERGINTLSPLSQLLGAIDELGEVRKAIRGGIENSFEIKRELGDVLVQLINYELKLGHLPDSITTATQQVSIVGEDTNEVLFTLVQTLCVVHAGYGEERFIRRNTFYSLFNELCRRYGTTPQAALDAAYEKIKDREGRLVGDKYVKKEDLNDKSKEPRNE